MDNNEETLRLAAQLSLQLQRLVKTVEDRDAPSPAVIGAVAAAAYGYVRATNDLDLASAVMPGTLSAFAAHLKHQGMQAHFEYPDGSDPLGGVLTVKTDTTKPIQFVNYINPFRTIPTVGIDALKSASAIEGGGLPLVSLNYLIMLKLYAGGLKSLADIVELLKRNPDVDIVQLRSQCEHYNLEEALDSVIEYL